MVVSPISQFNTTTGELLHYVEDDNTSVSPIIQSSRASSGIQSPKPAVHKVVLHRPPKAFRVTRILIPKPKKAAAAILAFGSLRSISIEAASTTAASRGAGVVPPPLTSIPATTSLPELVVWED
ncbi:hypothetical protein D8674_028558 [Pyrus ussuriensis x Pyrus communis]|uniref:Uncharacterized protein n=1 Tax=Pyrus ussuriensis x Pyrus communis TaxID=2448454 RepID=A0A5N5I1H5_9ROSA|nr:hypothetical protein D8674_028558 [Pyrus ussuriensis x Pyrus communis]